jgi:hypothetical protein
MPSLTLTVHGADRVSIIDTASDAIQEIQAKNSYTTGSGTGDQASYSFSITPDTSSNSSVPPVPPVPTPTPN